LSDDTIIASMLALVILSGVVLIALTLRNRQRMRELAMRERIAIIEKGLIPPPEIDPARFDRFDRFDRIERLLTMQRRLNAGGARYRSLGTMMMGLGVGLVVLLTFAAREPGVGLGVGGALVVLGAAMFLNGMMLAHTGPDASVPPSYSPPAAPPEPPTNVAP